MMVQQRRNLAYVAFRQMIASILAYLVGLSVAQAGTPWLMNTPIVTVKKAMICKHAEPANGVSVKQYNAGPGLQRIKSLGFHAKSDWGHGFGEWISSDNGKTWTGIALPNRLIPRDSPAGRSWWKDGFTNALMVYDPASKALIRPYYIVDKGKTDHTYTFYCLSFDFGRTWTKPKQLKYEPGPDFDPANPLNPEWVAKNNCQRPKNVTLTSAGTVVMAASYADDPANPTQSKPRLAALNFVGKWNPAKRDYDWTAGQRVVISKRLTSRGLLEAVSAELKPGGTPWGPPRILVIWRGSNTKTTPGRKWCSVSDDGGLTLEPVRELKYDDGTSFYSPSTMSELIRAKSNGKLYWIGNISPKPPKGNSPRHPLVIAEVDEDLVALKKDSVTVIADREPDQPKSVQYSNFSVLENMGTGEIEIYVSDIGALSNSRTPKAIPNVFDFDSYKYTLRFVNPGPVGPRASVNTLL